MDSKEKKIVLVIVTIVIAVMFVIDFIENGDFVFTRGNTKSSLAIGAGLVCLALAWIEYFRGKGKEDSREKEKKE